MAKNEKCNITDSELCKWLEKECADCFINSMKDKSDAENALENFKVTLSLLPENIDDLLGEDCCFCVEDKQKRNGYAIIDMGHSEPENKRGMFFGLGKKVRQRIGSLMPFSISICRRCKSNFKKLEALKWVSLVLFIGIAVGLCFIPEINAVPALPYGVILIGGIIGYIAGKALSQFFLNAKSRQTYFNVFEIPVCAQLQEKGWFTVQDNNRVTHFLFSKKPMMKKVSELCKTAKEPQEQIAHTTNAED